MLLNQVKINNYKGERHKIESDKLLCKSFTVWEGTINVDATVLAVDPGINFGLTLIKKGKVYCVSGKIEPCEPSLERACRIPSVVREILYLVGGDKASTLEAPPVPSGCIGAIEGSAFNKHYRQTLLAEVRMGFYLAIRRYSRELPKVIPPMTARKLATGSGKEPVYLKYPLMNPNAADSLGIAIAAIS